MISTRTPRSGILRRIYSEEEGMALVLVVGSMLLLMSFLLVGLTYAMSSVKFSRHNQDYLAAMAAAQAGIDDFISRLNADDLYGRTVDCSNPAMVTPADCGTSDFGWQPVEPGATDPAAPAFHYTVNTEDAFATGTIGMVSTGRSNGVYRTIEVAVGKGGSTDYVYYTDFESLDPENPFYSSTPPNQCGTSGTHLARYFWDGRTGCTEIQFGPNDVLDGRVFSNDAIWSVGGRFLQGIESAYPNCRNVTATRSTWGQCLRSGSTLVQTGATATFGVQPKYARELHLADSSAEFAHFPGCHYYGATRIVFNSNGTMTVWSPDSKAASDAGAEIRKLDDEGEGPANCGDPAALNSPSGATVPLPSDYVIYAAPVPTSAGVPQQIVPSQFLANELPLGSYSPTVNSGVAGSAGHSTSGNPNPNTCNTSYRCYEVDKSMLDTRKYRQEGNIYIQGVIKGRVTVAAAQSVVVTGDLMLAGGLNGDDLLGLVATNTVEIMHPRIQKFEWTNCTRLANNGSCNQRGSWQYRTWSGEGYYPSGTWPKRVANPLTGANEPTRGIQIQGSIQTLQHSFAVQYFNEGRGRAENGAIWVRGSIAQRYRGAVGQSGSPGKGYDKDYRYDARLKYTAPPYFPHWANAQWSQRYTGEVTTPDELRG